MNIKDLEGLGDGDALEGLRMYLRASIRTCSHHIESIQLLQKKRNGSPMKMAYYKTYKARKEFAEEILEMLEEKD